MNVQNNSISSYMSKLDQEADTLVFISTLTNLVDIALKCFVYFIDKPTIDNNPYLYRLKHKSFSRCLVTALPIIGNLYADSRFKESVATRESALKDLGKDPSRIYDTFRQWEANPNPPEFFLPFNRSQFIDDLIKSQIHNLKNIGLQFIDPENYRNKYSFLRENLCATMNEILKYKSLQGPEAKETQLSEIIKILPSDVAIHFLGTYPQYRDNNTAKKFLVDKPEFFHYLVQEKLKNRKIDSDIIKDEEINQILNHKECKNLLFPLLLLIGNNELREKKFRELFKENPSLIIQNNLNFYNSDELSPLCKNYLIDASKNSDFSDRKYRDAIISASVLSFKSNDLDDILKNFEINELALFYQNSGSATRGKDLVRVYLENLIYNESLVNKKIKSYIQNQLIEQLEALYAKTGAILPKDPEQRHESMIFDLKRRNYLTPSGNFTLFAIDILLFNGCDFDYK